MSAGADVVEGRKYENDSEEISEASENDSASDSDVTVFENVAALHRRPWPAKVTVTVKLPAVASASALRVEMTDAAVSVATKKTSRRDVKKKSDASDAYALEVVLPFPVDDDDAGVVFDSRARTLAIVALYAEDASHVDDASATSTDTPNPDDSTDTVMTYGRPGTNGYPPPVSGVDHDPLRRDDRSKSPAECLGFIRKITSSPSPKKSIASSKPLASCSPENVNSMPACMPSGKKFHELSSSLSAKLT